MNEQELVEEIAKAGVNLYAFSNLWKRLNKLEKDNWREWARNTMLPIISKYYKEAKK